MDLFIQMKYQNYYFLFTEKARKQKKERKKRELTFLSSLMVLLSKTSFYLNSHIN